MSAEKPRNVRETGPGTKPWCSRNILHNDRISGWPSEKGYRLASSHVTNLDKNAAILRIHPQSLPHELVTNAVIFQPCSMTHVVSFTIFFFKIELLIRRKPFVQFLLHLTTFPRLKNYPRISSVYF